MNREDEIEVTAGFGAIGLLLAALAFGLGDPAIGWALAVLGAGCVGTALWIARP